MRGFDHAIILSPSFLDAFAKTFISGMKLSNCPTFRACLHGRGGPHEGEVTRLGGVTRLSI